eukprot:scaffold201397_cov24-Attheya_sp.AAC.1
MPSRCRAASGMQNEYNPYYPGIVKRIFETSTRSSDRHDPDCDKFEFEFEFASGDIISAIMKDLLFVRVPKSGYPLQQILKVSPKTRTTAMTAANNGPSCSHSSSSATKQHRSPKRKIHDGDSGDDEIDTLEKELLQNVRSHLNKMEETLTRSIHAHIQKFKSKRNRTKQNRGGGGCRQKNIKKRHTVVNRVAKEGRCGKCNACAHPDCEHCENCQDMKKYGGPGIKHQRCAKRLPCEQNWSKV